jgi:hypothetical protein
MFVGRFVLILEISDRADTKSNFCLGLARSLAVEGLVRSVKKRLAETRGFSRRSLSVKSSPSMIYFGRLE